MRDFDTVVGVDGINVLDRRHDFTLGRIITAEFVGDQPTRFSALAFQQAAKEAHRRLLVASPLHQNINGLAILIHRAPEILLFSVNRDDRFIQMSGIAQAALLFFQFSRIGRAKL